MDISKFLHFDSFYVTCNKCASLWNKRQIGGRMVVAREIYFRAAAPFGFWKIIMLTLIHQTCTHLHILVFNDSSGVVAMIQVICFGQKMDGYFTPQKQSEIRRNLFCRPVAEISCTDAHDCQRLLIFWTRTNHKNRNKIFGWQFNHKN